VESDEQEEPTEADNSSAHDETEATEERESSGDDWAEDNISSDYEL